MRSGDSVVPIGGAPFIRPYTNMHPIDTSMASHRYSGSSTGIYSPASSSSSSSASSSSAAVAMSSYSPNSSLATTDSGDLGCAASSSPSSKLQGKSRRSSSSNYNSATSPQLEAALRYSFAVHEHTRKMWERERFNIERSKFGGANNEESSPTAAAAPSSTSNAPSSLAQSDATNAQKSHSHRRGSWGGGLASVDALWNRKKKHTKNSFSIY